MSREEWDEIEREENDGTSRIAWFMTGAIIGATVALLYAPKPGKDTRQFLTDKAQQGRDKVTDATKDITETSREMFERGRKLVEDAAELFDRGRKLVKG